MRVIFPGTFDPITTGHQDLILRAANLFDEVIVAVADNTRKSPLFDIRERVELISDIVDDLSNVSVKGFSGLLAEFALHEGAQAVVRGLRAVSDFEYEFQLSAMNRHLAKDVETIFLTPDVAHSFVSSSLVKEVASLGGDISKFVPPNVETALLQKLDN